MRTIFTYRRAETENDTETAVVLKLNRVTVTRRREQGRMQ